MRVVEEGVFQVEKPPEEVLALLKNPEMATRVLPGLSGVKKSGDGYVATMDVSLGHLSGKMAVKFRVEEVGDVVVVKGSASGLQSAADFILTVSAQPSGGGSVVKWRFEASARGLVANLAPSLVQVAIRKVAEAAVSNLANYLK